MDHTAMEKKLVNSEGQRRSLRTRLNSDIALTHPSIGTLLLQTEDLSGAGAFILSAGHVLPGIGEIVALQVQGLGGEQAPSVRAEVMRADERGIGVRFL